MTKAEALIPGVVVCLGVLLLTSVPAASRGQAGEPVTPVVSEDVAPLESIAPVARDGHRGEGLLRKPPGAGPYPAVVWIHGGLTTVPIEALKDLALRTPPPSRFLAAGYVVAVITYRSRDVDPQSSVSLEDSLAAVEYVRGLPYVDPSSVVVYGCSGGGDLALEVAASTHVAAIVAEEPASMLFTGVWNVDLPKRGERYAPGDSRLITEDPLRYYTAPHQAFTREKIDRISSPILILQGDEAFPLNRFNAQVLIPELRSAGKTLEINTYPGEPHCFASSGIRPRPAVALQAFRDADAFFREHLNTQPHTVDDSLVEQVPLFNPSLRTLVWVGRNGEEEPIGMTPRAYSSPQLSPDGRRVVVDTEGFSGDLFLYDLETQVEEQFTFDPSADWWPLWSPDGSQIVFSSSRHRGRPNLYVKPADGSGSAERLTTSPFPQAAADWVDNGETLTLGQIDPETGMDILTLQFGADAEPEPLLETDANEAVHSISPNGRWVAYRSDESGERRIYVRPFPNASSGGQRLISDGPGSDPLWGPDGRELFYLTPEAAMVVPVETGDTFQRGSPQRLFSMDPYNDGLSRSWDISPDGQRFLMIKR